MKNIAAFIGVGIPDRLSIDTVSVNNDRMNKIRLVRVIAVRVCNCARKRIVLILVILVYTGYIINDLDELCIYLSFGIFGAVDVIFGI